MQPLIWEVNRYGGMSAKAEEGYWYLSPNDVAQIKFNLPSPPDMGIGDFMKYRTERREADGWSKEVQRLDAMMPAISGEIGYGESVEEAKHLVEALRIGSEGLPTWQEAVAALGFTQTYPGHETLSGMYGLTIKSGTFGVHVWDEPLRRAIHVTYEGHGVAHWHNVARFNIESETHASKEAIYRFFPDATQDPFAVMMSHVGWVLEQRQARENTKLSTPLGGSIPRRKY